MSTDTNVIDAATAESILIKDREALAHAKDRTSEASSRLTNLVVAIRPAGTLTVAEIAEAIDRDRNFVDTLWSGSGNALPGKQTRVPLADVSDATREAAVRDLADAAGELRRAVDAEDVARAERNRNVALTYASKALRVVTIARIAEIDRNHVGRIARAHGVEPKWRTPGSSRNQWTKNK